MPVPFFTYKTNTSPDRDILAGLNDTRVGINNDDEVNATNLQSHNAHIAKISNIWICLSRFPIFDCQRKDIFNYNHDLVESYNTISSQQTIDYTKHCWYLLLSSQFLRSNQSCYAWICVSFKLKVRCVWCAWTFNLIRLVHLQVAMRRFVFAKLGAHFNIAYARHRKR